MEFTVKRYHEKKWSDISGRVGNLSWNDDLDALGDEFNFTFAQSIYDSNFKSSLTLGDMVKIKSDNNEVLRGIITETPINGTSYKGYDFAFYLNKSEVVIQFKGIAADKAIEQLLKRYDIPHEPIPKMSTSIKKVYKDVTVSDVLLDILKKHRQESKKSYKMEMYKGKLRFVDNLAKKIKPTYTDELGRKVLCTRAANITGTRSIAELRNKVVVSGNSDKSKQIKAIATASKSIEKYGLLTAVETVDKITTAKAKNKAKNILEDLNKVVVEFTAEMPGNHTVKSGRLLNFDIPELNIKGWYRVKSCTHTVTGSGYRMSCEMERL